MVNKGYQKHEITSNKNVDYLKTASHEDVDHTLTGVLLDAYQAASGVGASNKDEKANFVEK